MNFDIMPHAEPIVSDMLNLSAEDLFYELALRTQAMQNDPQLGGDLDPDFDRSQEPMAGYRVVMESYVDRVNRDAFTLICGDSDPRWYEIHEIFNEGPVRFGAALTEVLAASHLLPKLLAPVVATLFTTMLMDGGGALCEMWESRLPQA